MIGSTRRRALLPFLLGGPVLVAALGLRAFWLEPASLGVRRITVTPPGWPARCDGLEIALIGDLHVGAPHSDLAQLGRIVELANAARPDLILLAGDSVIQGVAGGRPVPPEPIAARLAGLRAPLGVYAVLGNHDWWLDGSRVTAALTNRGVRVLEDEAVRLQLGSGDGACSFWLAGIGDYWETPHDAAATLEQVGDDSAPIIVLTHNPDLFPELPPGIALSLAGHTHGGQVSLPLIGAPVVPSRYGQRYAAGLVVEDGERRFITPGVGTSIYPVRFLVPPEISLLQLRASSQMEYPTIR